VAETSVVGTSRCDAYLPLAPVLDFNARLATGSMKVLDRDEWPLGRRIRQRYGVTSNPGRSIDGLARRFATIGFVTAVPRLGGGYAATPPRYAGTRRHAAGIGFAA
jgi:hypothetical protein